MSRFAAPDLAALGEPPALETIDYEDQIRRRLAALYEQSRTHGFAWNVGALETDPLVIDQQVNAYFDGLLRARVNDGIRAVLLTSAQGGQLDQIAATYYGISRLAGEADDDFRARIALAPEAWSTAGPSGAYVFHGLEADPDVRDVAVFSEEDGAVYADGTPVLAPEVLMVVLAHSGDGTPSPDLLAKVLADASRSETRPIGDRVVVEAARIVTYEIEAVLKIRNGVDAALLLQQAEENVRSYLDRRSYIGRLHQRGGIFAALSVTDTEEVVIASPAGDIDPGSKGAAFCTNITITTDIAPENWR